MTIAADAAFLQSSNGALYQNHLLNVQCERLCENTITADTPKKVKNYVTKLLRSRLPSYGDQLELEETDVLKKSTNYIPTYALHVMVDPPEDKDSYKNNGYFDYRNGILLDVAKKLLSNGEETDLKWQYSKGSSKKILLITEKSFRIMIDIRMNSIDWIPRIRLVPNRSNLTRQKTSIRYNYELSDDFAFYDFQMQLFGSYSNARQAFGLFQIWCVQRELNTIMGYDDMCAILLYLYRTKRANARQTPLQVLTHVWTLFMNPGIHVIPSDDASEGQTIDQCSLANTYRKLSKETPLTENDAPTLVELYKRIADLVILDDSMRHNYTGHYDASFIRTLRKLAGESLQFDYRHMFLTRDGFWTRYDTYLRIDIKGTKTAPNSDDNIRHAMVEKLHQALGDRVSEIRIHHEALSFPISKFDAVKPKASTLVLGFNVNADTSFRIVDRGPPSSDSEAVETFRKLWGEKAELRRFKDGAIIYAVVWDPNDESFSNEAAWQAGIVKTIARHILETHFCPDKIRSPSSDEMAALVDGIPNTAIYAPLTDPMEANRGVMKAFEQFANLLRSKTAKTISGGHSNELRSPLGLPLSIDAVEPLDPSLRYSALYPPIPHPMLGGNRPEPSKKVAGAICFDPIRIQVRFGVSTKWPTELKAIQAAERAMLIELVNGLDRFDYIAQSIVTERYADVCYMGYVWRLNVRADPEINFLRGLNNPSVEARKLLAELEKTNVAAPMHHTLVHSVFTKNPSSSAVVRLAKRWLSSHMLQIPFEAIELMVCAVYSVANPPGTLDRGFERWLNLLSTHDWLREPLIVDPEAHFSESERSAIEAQFKTMRGKSLDEGPPLCIFSPSNKPAEKEGTWTPTFVASNDPEKVILCRAVALARRSHDFLQQLLLSNLLEKDAKLKQNWSSIFLESPDAFQSFSALLRLKPDFVTNHDASSTSKNLCATMLPGESSSSKMTSFTRSMKELTYGPKPLRRTMFKNLIANQSKELLLDWNPIRSTASVLKDSSLAEHALFLYNDLCPDVIGIVWRKHDRRPFSAVTSEYVRPVSEDNWKTDTLVVLNIHDIIRGTCSVFSDMIAGVKVFDHGPAIEPAQRTAAERTRKRDRSNSVADEDDESSSIKKDDDSASTSD